MTQSNKRSADNLGRAIDALVQSKLDAAAKQVERAIGQPATLDMFGPGGNGGVSGIISFRQTTEREHEFFQKIMPTAPPPPTSKKQQLREQMLRYAKPWSLFETKVTNPLVLQAATYKPTQLFPDCPKAYFGTGSEDVCVYSPQRTFAYANRVLPRAYSLPLQQNSTRGEVYFDDDVVIPTLYKPERPLDVWMSLSPQELITLRPGIRKAKGRVIVGGLGLGWLLTEICNKDIVTEVILVEQDKELMEWYGEALCRRLPKLKDVIVDDFYNVAGRFGKNSRYILDFWKSYGAAREDERLQAAKKWIANIWAWGDVQT